MIGEDLVALSAVVLVSVNLDVAVSLKALGAAGALVAGSGGKKLEGW